MRAAGGDGPRSWDIARFPTSLAFAALVLSTLAACSGAHADRGRAAGRAAATGSQSPPTTTVAPTATTAADPCASPTVAVAGTAGQSVFVPDAHVATALAWAPDGRLFFAERSGAIRIAGAHGVTTFTTVPTVTTEAGGGYSERGLLGLALSPGFATDHLVYAFSSRPDRASQVVQRYHECNGTASEPETVVNLPAGNDCCHKGGRIAFGPDGKLYVSLGDEHAVRSGTVAGPDSIPQDPTDARGKVLRYNPDGTIPADNPFGPDSPVWAAGFRNVYGIAFGDGTAFVSANGPTGELGWRNGMDLALMIGPGFRGQWPACAGYSHVAAGATDCLGRPEPDWSSEDVTVVPTGATWVDAAGPAPFAGHFVFCTYDDGMRIFTPATPHATVDRGPSACRLDVVEGPDHALYFSDESAIYRLGA